MPDDLARIEPWIAPLIEQLKPGARRKIAVKVGQYLRRENAARIAANIEPDGSAMQPRKPRKTRRAAVKTGRIKKKGKMFRKIAKARSLKVRAQPDGVEVSFANPLIEKTAAEHQYGLEGFVGRTKSGTTVRTRYPERKLLGFGRKDPEAIMDLVIAQLTEG